MPSACHSTARASTERERMGRLISHHLLYQHQLPHPPVLRTPHSDQAPGKGNTSPPFCHMQLSHSSPGLFLFPGTPFVSAVPAQAFVYNDLMRSTPLIKRAHQPHCSIQLYLEHPRSVSQRVWEDLLGVQPQLVKSVHFRTRPSNPTSKGV